MNLAVLMGRLCDEPTVNYSQSGVCVARYRLAVDRRGAKENEQKADFIGILALGKSGEFAEKYLHKGTKVVVSGRIQTGSYTKQDGTKAYTTEVLVNDQEFAESKKDSSATPANNDEWQNIPEGITEDLPFK